MGQKIRSKNTGWAIYGMMSSTAQGRQLYAIALAIGRVNGWPKGKRPKR